MKIYTVDAFSTEPFRGNPAAVCLIDDSIDEEQMQSVAFEMNLAETAFVRPAREGFDLRWFTPRSEVDLCGHATIAAAHVLLHEEGGVAGSQLEFYTRSGPIKAYPDDCDDCPDDHRIWLDFPAFDVTPCGSVPDIQDVVSLPGSTRIVECFESEFSGKPIVFLRLESAADVRTAIPKIADIESMNVGALVLTADSPGASDYDFVSRFFAPAFGIPEDPVTGSAHSYLAPYWAGVLGKKELCGRQASPRGGVVYCKVSENGVRIGGNAVTLIRGRINLPNPMAQSKQITWSCDPPVAGTPSG